MTKAIRREAEEQQREPELPAQKQPRSMRSGEPRFSQRSIGGGRVERSHRVDSRLRGREVRALRIAESRRLSETARHKGTALSSVAAAHTIGAGSHGQASGDRRGVVTVDCELKRRRVGRSRVAAWRTPLRGYGSRPPHLLPIRSSSFPISVLNRYRLLYPPRKLDGPTVQNRPHGV